MSTKNLHPNTAKIELDFPIEISGVEVKHLVIRRPKVRDDLAASKTNGSDEDKSLALVSNLCEVTIDDLLGLDSADYGKLERQVQDFRQAKR